MEDLSLNLNALPDEILIFILKKLDHVEVLYSLTGVNKRRTTIAHDSIFTSHLTLYFSDKCIKPLPDPILDRFCSQILPEIHPKIEWLNLEPTSMECILCATNYLYLYGLGLYGVSIEQAIFLTGRLFHFNYVNSESVRSK
ncbi:unnamed protein product [Rotaria sp. Silwood1]|nr:unnamed protein product [Rotaria sp. Silwood1]CAF1062376.1 unnamed protein product [Rotaria sp. Silwood1]CAF3404971.1 unnamed protein product [Rotaria sp. Silwood1]CAF3429567.1 unnamed protein product [Rotaria sp. Silwood1]CAF4609193.1 unnamed protein product [Rotaria sp. Silwood1]